MRRNLSHRVEIIFPIESARLVRRLKDILDVYLADEAKVRYLQPDGSYTRSPRRKEPGAVNAQASFLGPGLPPENARPGTSFS